jgi:iron complex transport system permease protein
MDKETRVISTKYIFIILLILLFLILLFSLSVGRYTVSISDLYELFLSKIFSIETDLPSVTQTVIFNIRIPRIVGAILVGAALSVSGAAYQGIFKNPLVSPDIIGASSGAGFGASLAILLSLNALGIQIMAFVFSLVAVFSTYFLGIKLKKGDPTLILILTGMLIGTLFSSFISFIKYVADPYEELPAITFWLMGSLSMITMKDIVIIIVPIIVGFVLLYLIRWRLNSMSFGDEEAQALGVNTSRLRFIVILASTLLTAAAVSISGVIGWVGLLIPHLARMIVGPNYKLLIPASIILGSTFLLLVDTIARIVLPMEIPIGILTSIIGAPAFIYLLSFSKRRDFS